MSEHVLKWNKVFNLIVSNFLLGTYTFFGSFFFVCVCVCVCDCDGQNNIYIINIIIIVFYNCIFTFHVFSEVNMYC